MVKRVLILLAVALVSAIPKEKVPDVQPSSVEIKVPSADPKLSLPKSASEPELKGAQETKKPEISAAVPTKPDQKANSAVMQSNVVPNNANTEAKTQSKTEVKVEHVAEVEKPELSKKTDLVQQDKPVDTNKSSPEPEPAKDASTSDPSPAPQPAQPTTEGDSKVVYDDVYDFEHDGASSVSIFFPLCVSALVWFRLL